MSTPLVSVVIPTHNRCTLLPRAVESVLGQTVKDVEVIVLDDGSADGTADVGRSFGPPVRYHQQFNQGLGAARRNAVALASGQYIALLDDDDEWLPEKLERQLAALADRPGTDFCYTQARLVFQNGRTVVKPTAPQGYEELQVQRTRIPPSSLLVRRNRVLEVGSFRSGLRSVDDWDFLLRLSARCEGVFVPEVLVVMHRHGQNLSSDAVGCLTDRVGLYRDFARNGFPRGGDHKLARRMLVRQLLDLGQAAYHSADLPRSQAAYREALALSWVAGLWVNGWPEDKPHLWMPIALLTPYAKWLRAALPARRFSSLANGSALTSDTSPSPVSSANRGHRCSRP